MEITAASIQLGKSKDTRFKGWAKISIDGILQITGIRFYENFNPETNERSRYFRSKIATAIFTEYDKVMAKRN